MTYENNIDDEGLLEYSQVKFKCGIKFRPLKISFGKIPNTFWVEPIFKTKTNIDWFYNEFVAEVRRLVKESGSHLKWNQRNPSYKNLGWYLPIEIIAYIDEIYKTENVGLIFDVLRPLSIYDYRFEEFEDND